jgi:hypothetical protein
VPDSGEWPLALALNRTTIASYFRLWIKIELDYENRSLQESLLWTS